MKEKIIKYLRSVCGNDPQVMLNFRGWDYEKIMEWGNFQKSDSVLDTGALHTYFSIYLAQFVEEVLVTDSFYWATRDYFGKPNENYGGKILPTINEWTDFVEKFGFGKTMVDTADVMNLQYPDNTFDKVLSISTIEHVLDDRLGIVEMMRVLKPGGSLLLTTEFNAKKPMEYNKETFLRIYDDAGINRLFHGFKIESGDLCLDENKDWSTIFIKVTK